MAGYCFVQQLYCSVPIAFMENTQNTHVIPIHNVSRILILFNICVACLYFSWWFDVRHIGNFYLYVLLFLGECYHVFMAIAFWLTIWPPKKEEFFPNDAVESPFIDVFIPVTGEPISVIRETIIAAKNMNGYEKEIYILNDGYVAKNDNWRDVEILAKTLHVQCITRQIASGAKAGNINNALAQTKGDFVAIFDADMKAYPTFLERLMPYFQNQKIGFVQSPQYYANFKDNYVTAGAWEQQQFFYGAIMQGKSYRNSAFICGTNVIIRRKALEDVGGMYEKNIAEDFLTSLFIHAKGWESLYTREVLSEGLAPTDIQSYYNQQLRWASGSLEVLFWKNPFLIKNLTFSQKIQYVSSAAYYFNGVIVLIDSIMPIIFLLTGTQVVAAATTLFAFYFVPFMALNLYTLYLASANLLTFRAISFSQASFVLQLQAVFAALLRRKLKFVVTGKGKKSGNFFYLVIPHVVYIGIAIFAIIHGIGHYGITPSAVTNISWILFNTILFMPFIRAAMPIKNSGHVSDGLMSFPIDYATKK